MEFLKEMFFFLKEYYADILIALSLLIGSFEIITRMTPTKKDDGAVMRIGGMLKKLMDSLKIPNNLKEPKKLEEKKEESPGNK